LAILAIISEAAKEGTSHSRKRYAGVAPKLRRQIQLENKQLCPPHVYNAEA